MYTVTAETREYIRMAAKYIELERQMETIRQQMEERLEAMSPAAREYLILIAEVD